jgi:tetratricopeptide (TPR) repeat protein
MGNFHYQQGDYEAARQAYVEALELFMSFQSEIGLAYGRMNLGNTLFHLGDVAAATKLYREALPIYLKVQNKEGIVWALERIGIAEARHGDARKAARLLGAASTMREELGIAMSLLDQKDWEKALDELRSKLQQAVFTEAFEEDHTLSCEQAAEMDTALPEDAVFDAAWQEGRAMTREQAIAYAIEGGFSEA